MAKTSAGSKTKAELRAESAAINTAAKAQVDRSNQVIRKLTHVPDEGKGKIANLPLVSAVFETKTEMERAITLLETGHAFKDAIDRATKGWVDGETGAHVDGLEETKDEVIGIAMGAEVPGYRYGTLAVAVSLIPGRRMLNKDMLREKLIDEGMDPGVVARVIEDSHAEGEPYYRAEFKKLL